MTPEQLASIDPIFAECLRVGGPLRAVFSRTGGFAGLIQIVFEQQLSTQVARVVWERFAAAVGDDVTPSRVNAMDTDAMRACGLSRQKIAYAKGIAEAVIEGRLNFSALQTMTDEDAVRSLVSLKGIGRWTADIYLMAGLGREDIWPVDDLAIILGIQKLKGLAEKPSRAALVGMADPWRPHRTLAANLVWHYYVSVQAAAKRTKSVV